MVTPDDDTSPSIIECPECGETAPIEALACPRCGLHFYDTGLEEDEIRAQAHPPVLRNPKTLFGLPLPQGFGASLLSVLTGWSAFFFSTLLFNLAITSLYRPGSIYHPTTGDGSGQALLWLASFSGAFLGGFFAARSAEQKPLIHGFAAALIAAPSSLIIESYWRDIAQNLLPPNTQLAWVIILAGGLLGALVEVRLHRLSSDSAPKSENELRLYFRLLSYVRHDINVAERLIQLEQHRSSPNTPRARLIQNAIARIDRDRK